MSHRPSAALRAAYELALIGVTGHSVADIHCR
ncbi:Ms4533A family Cys-rich leader peptide [Streptomyces sp. NPDC000594]